MVNNSINITKMKNRLSPLLVVYINDHDLWRWKSRSWLGSGT